MMNRYLEFAKNLNDLTHRMEVLTKLCALTPGAEFFASDLGLSGQDVNALSMHGVIKDMYRDREEFICVDKYKELYKKIYTHCWVVINPNLHNDFKHFCGQMATLYSAQMLVLSRINP